MCLCVHFFAKHILAFIAWNCNYHSWLLTFTSYTLYTPIMLGFGVTTSCNYGGGVSYLLMWANSIRCTVCFHEWKSVYELKSYVTTNWFTHLGGDDEICPYATFHLLGFREEMDPQQAGNNFQTFPYQNGHGSQQNFVNSPASRSMVSGHLATKSARYARKLVVQPMERSSDD